MGKKGNRTYTEEFRQQSVSLAREIGYSKASRQLGVNVSNIHGWNKKIEKSGATPIKTEKFSYEAECKRLQKENAEQKKVIIILKAAAAFFSQDHLK